MRTETLVTVTVLALVAFIGPTHGQRISTIQLDGVQYFISRMNPYSPELNYFLAYQYCRSLGLQLTSFETKEKADAMATYLKNAGHHKHDFWTSGNKLGTDMMLWMSTGLPFNATFDYMNKRPSHNGAETEEEEAPVSGPSAEGDAENEARSDDGASHSCIALKAPDLHWAADDCTALKDFICEQTRCYYYNYGSVPVSAAQGAQKPHSAALKAPPSSTAAPITSTSPAVPSSIVTEVPSIPPAITSTHAPTVAVHSLPPLLNITVKRGMHLRASTSPPAPPTTPLPTSTRTSSPSPQPTARPTPSSPLLVSSIIASIEKAQRLNEAAIKNVDDHNKHVGRHIDGKNSNPNVVYVKAVGAKNGQAAWSLAYVNNKDNSSKANETLIDSRPIYRPTTVTQQDYETVNKRRALDPPADQ